LYITLAEYANGKIYNVKKAVNPQWVYC